MIKWPLVECLGLLNVCVIICYVPKSITMVVAEINKTNFVISNNEIYDNNSLETKIYFEIFEVSSYPYFEISIVEMQ